MLKPPNINWAALSRNLWANCKSTSTYVILALNDKRTAIWLFGWIFSHSAFFFSNKKVLRSVLVVCCSHACKAVAKATSKKPTCSLERSHGPQTTVPGCRVVPLLLMIIDGPVSLFQVELNWWPNYPLNLCFFVFPTLYCPWSKKPSFPSFFQWWCSPSSASMHRRTGEFFKIKIIIKSIL